jgi:hypothetical protein
MKRTIFISPHIGVPDFIWGNTRGSNPFKGFAGLVDTYSLGLSDNLVREFEAWVNDWHENFVDRNELEGMLVPVWREGFDSAKWRSQGVALMHRLQEERPDLNVRNGFDSDVYPTDPVTHEPQSD